MGGLAGCGNEADTDGGQPAAEATPPTAVAEQSSMAQDANAAVAEIKAELERGEDVKYSCAGNLGGFGPLAMSDDEAEKAAFAALQTVCYLDVSRILIADLRAKIENNALESFDAVNLETLIEAEDFPTDGEFAAVAAEAMKVFEVEIPVYHLTQAHEEAKQEKAAGEAVSMGCIRGEQVVEKSGEKISADADAKAALDAFRETCPAKAAG
ncbi:MAG: hypothetical protein AAGE01_09035 [Pseudomonadota bacterium]